MVLSGFALLGEAFTGFFPPLPAALVGVLLAPLEAAPPGRASSATLVILRSCVGFVVVTFDAAAWRGDLCTPEAPARLQHKWSSLLLLAALLGNRKQLKICCTSHTQGNSRQKSCVQLPASPASCLSWFRIKLVEGGSMGTLEWI